MKSLLEKARSIPQRRAVSDAITEEHIEAALAYIAGEVTLKQLAVALNDKNIYTKMLAWLKEAHRRGYLVIKV